MGAERDAGKRDRAVEALAAGANVSEASRLCGYTRKHLHHLLHDPRFLAEIEKRRAKIESSPASMDEALALDTLREIVVSEDAEDRDRIVAAKALLAHVSLGKKATRAGPQAPPPLKLVPGATGERAADEWLTKQA